MQLDQVVAAAVEVVSIIMPTVGCWGTVPVTVEEVA